MAGAGPSRGKAARAHLALLRYMKRGSMLREIVVCVKGMILRVTMRVCMLGEVRGEKAGG